MTLAYRPQPIPGYRLESIDDELLLFHPGSNKIICCNPSASLVWQLCDGRRTTQEIVTLLQASYPEAQETIAVEVEAILGQFAQHGAIQLV